MKREIPKGYDIADAEKDGITAEIIAQNLSSLLTKSPVQLIEERITSTEDKEELLEIALEVTSNLEISESLQHACCKKIANKMGTTTALLKADCRKFLTNQQQAGDADNELYMARSTILSFGQDNLIYAQASFYKYDIDKPHHWQRIEDRAVRQAIHQSIKEGTLTKHKIDSIIDLTKTEVYLPNHDFDRDNQAVTVINGRLVVDGGNFVLKEHDKFQYTITALPIAFDPKATAPRFELFLEEIFIDDLDKEAKKRLLLEAMGYTLMKTCKFEKYFILVGAGRNGKSVFVNTLKELLGHANVSCVQLNQLTNKFQRAHLAGKLANLVTEIGEGEKLPDAEIKAIASGERITVEQKYKDPFDFEPYATLWFATNHLPHSRDYSDAMHRRAIIIPFNRQFKDEEIDVSLLGKLKDELPGILSLALSALKGLLNRNSFTTPSSCKAALDEWRKQSDQILQFIEERCDLDNENMTISGDLYKAYQAWAMDNGIHQKCGHCNFTQRLEKSGVRTSKGTNGVRMLQGIKLKWNGESGGYYEQTF